MESARHIESFSGAYSDLRKILQSHDIDAWNEDLVMRRAIERLLSLMAVSVKRYVKSSGDEKLPHLKTMIRLKNRIIWEDTALKKRYVQYIIYTVLPEINDYFSNIQTQNNGD